MLPQIVVGFEEIRLVRHSVSPEAAPSSFKYCFVVIRMVGAQKFQTEGEDGEENTTYHFC